MTLLARTPPPFPTESLLGYVLRVSEQNGYESPWQVFRAAGFSQGRMRTTGIDTERLAAVLGRDASELRFLAYSDTAGEGQGFVLLGNKVSSRQLRLAKPQICPLCIAEKGFIEAHFDLTQLTACPEHRCELLSSCPSCGKGLRWFRPGLLTCTCGHELRDSALPVVPAAVADLMAAVRTVALHLAPGDTSDELAADSGIPLAHLRNMSLRSLLAVISALGQHSPAIPGDLGRSLAINAARALGNWPENFHQLLRDHAAAGSNPAPATVGLRKRFATLYGQVFKRSGITSAEVGFMRQEFLRFGLQQWGEGVVDTKLLKDSPVPAQSNFVSLTQAAAQLGLDTRTVVAYAEKGLIQMKTVQAGKSTRVVVDIRTASMPKRAPGKSFRHRKAAAFLGLPVSVLRSLQRTGDYEARHLAHVRKAFHELDLKAFLAKCLARTKAAPRLEKRPAELMSLADAMRRNVRSADSKADILRALLQGTLQVIARTDDSLSGILFRREQIEELLHSKRLENYGDNPSLDGAAKRVGCSPTVVPALLENGLLESVVLYGETRITDASIKAFASTYVSLASLSKPLGRSARSLAMECRTRGVPVQSFQRANQSSSQSFLQRAHVPTEWLEPEQYVAERKRLAEEKLEERAHSTPAAKLRRYLDGLAASPTPLPRRGRKPNRRAIANACGFDRNVLYRDREVVAMLAAFVAEKDRLTPAVAGKPRPQLESSAFSA